MPQALRRWTTLSGVVAVAVALAVGAAAAAPIIVSTTQTEVTIGGLTCGTQYRVRVNVTGSSRVTTLKAVTKPCPLPHPPPPPEPSPPPPPPSPPPPPPPVEPGPIAGQGYSRVFGDEFDALNRGIWCNRQWWEPSPPVNSQYVDTGILHLVRKRSQGFQNTTISSEPCGQTTAKSFKQGYFEARIRGTSAVGAGPALWLFSTRHATNPAWPNVNPYCQQNGLPVAECHSAELDVYEGYGFWPDVFTGTLHSNSCGCYGVGNQTNAGINSWQPQGFNIHQDWHVFSVLWTTTQVKWYLDEQLSHTWNAYASTNQPLHVILSNWNTVWEPQNMPNSSTPDELHTEVDWVRVWQQ
jgi:Glycosyl hydrolases family 16